jgi:dCTP deaminase
MILSDFDLLNYIRSGRLKIVNFDKNTIRENGIDFRLGYKFKRMVKKVDSIYDTKREQVEKNYYYEEETTLEKGFIIEPNERILVTTLEYIKLPLDLMAFCELRSSFARLGLSIPPTIIDAGFEGVLVIEIIGGQFPIRLYPEQRFLHGVFSKLTTPLRKGYKGKYHKQKEVVVYRPDKENKKNRKYFDLKKDFGLNV